MMKSNDNYPWHVTQAAKDILAGGTTPAGHRCWQTSPWSSMSLITSADPHKDALVNMHCNALRNRIGDLISYADNKGDKKRLSANDYCAQLWDNFFDKGLKKGQHALQIREGGQISGIIVYGPSTTKKDKRTAEISYLEVNASGSAKGHRRSLVMHALTDLYKQGYTQVCAHTSPDRGDNLGTFFRKHFSPAANKERPPEMQALLPVTPYAPQPTKLSQDAYNSIPASHAAKSLLYCMIAP